VTSSSVLGGVQKRCTRVTARFARAFTAGGSVRAERARPNAFRMGRVGSGSPNIEAACAATSASFARTSTRCCASVCPSIFRSP
jgi:hypothetical protein